MKWGERETTLFTKIYLKHPCLWDPKDASYRHRDRKRSAFREIIAEFYDACGIKLTEAEVQMKLKSLRSTYSQELQKIRVRSSAEWTYVPTLKWFHEWHKHLGPTRARETGRHEDENRVIINNYDYDTKKSDNEDAFEDDQNDDNIENIESSQEQVWVSSQEEIPEPFPTETEEDLDFKPELPTPELPRFKSKKRKFRNRHISTDSDRNDRLSFSSNQSEPKDDEFDIYGKYIATQLRKMDLQKALRVQLEIQSLVSEARISDMNGT